jgi:tetratricopeptide (TPR) repeat protein
MIALMAASSAAGQYYTARATDAVRNGSVTKFLENVEMAERYAPASFIEPEVQLAGFYIDVIGGAGMLFSKEEGVKMSADALALLEQAESMNPSWAEIDFKRGRLHAVRNELDLAALSYERALEKDPLHFHARFQLAEAAYTAGRPARAYDLLAAGLKYPQPHQARKEYEALLVHIADVAKLQKEFTEEGKSP